MSQPTPPRKKVSKIQLLALGLILIGLAIMLPRGFRMYQSYQEIEFARKHQFQTGDVSPDLLRPWMTIRYIAVSYAVPQEYLFDAVGIPPRRENSMISIARLNQQLGLGTKNGEPIVLDRIGEAILAYRANPVPTGLIERQVMGWMNLQYIANSTGIPTEVLFDEIGIPANGNAYIPLDVLSDKLHYEGGPRSLVQAVQRVVDAHSEKKPQ
ncbi:MAG: hypothetical protein HPY59_14885 [Anaerolineae bacterium]|nr:hypothetical protein [Anaerolineae bacterium]